MLNKIIPYGGGLLAFFVVGYLLYLVCRELFITGGKQRSESEQPLNEISRGERYLPVILPAVLSCVMLAVYMMFSSYNCGSRLRISQTGIFQLSGMGPEGSLAEIKARLLCAVSALFYIGGSLLIYFITKENAYDRFSPKQKWRASEMGIRAAVFFCIAPFSVFMVLPFQYSAAVFFLLAAFYAYQKGRFVPALLCLAGAMVADELCILPVIGFAIGLLYSKRAASDRKRGFLLAGCGLLLFILREVIFQFLFDVPFVLFDRFLGSSFFVELIIFCFPLYIYGAGRIREEKHFTALWTGEGLLCGLILMYQAAIAIQ